VIVPFLKRRRVFARMRLDTLTLRYWQNFGLADGELEYLSELLIEEESPLTIEALALRLMEKRVKEEEAAWEERRTKGLIYQPRESYVVGDRLVFSALGDAVGSVVQIRPGYNPHSPEYGPFEVVQVQIEGEDRIREFASNLSSPHALNFIAVDKDEDLDLNDMTALSERLYERYGHYVTPFLLAKMRENPEFVNFGERWFLKGFLLPIEQGHLNLAEAVLDLAGGFSTVDEVLQVLELPKQSSRAVQIFSLNYHLLTDGQGRFEFAGTKDRTEWCLPGVAASRALRFEKGPEDLAPDHILGDVVEILGDGMGVGEAGRGVKQWSHVLTFYDWYWGHLPYVKGASELLVSPLSEGQRFVRLQFMFRDSEEVFPVVLHYPKERELGWLGGAELRKFFEEQELVPGATVLIESTASSDIEHLYQVSYYPAPFTKLEMLDYEEGGQPVFRRVNVRCEVDEEMSLPRSRFSALETLRLLEQEERRDTLALLVAAFQRVGEKLLKGLGIVYRASFSDLFVAANIDRPFPETILTAIFEQRAYPCFYLDDEGFYVYDPSRSKVEVSKVRLTRDEAILDAGSSNLLR
jgi:hypothetical protein